MIIIISSTKHNSSAIIQLPPELICRQAVRSMSSKTLLQNQNYTWCCEYLALMGKNSRTTKILALVLYSLYGRNSTSMKSKLITYATKPTHSFIVIDENYIINIQNVLIRKGQNEVKYNDLVTLSIALFDEHNNTSEPMLHNPVST